MQVERRGLEAHLSQCNFRRECPKGCGRMIPSPEQSQHNCVAELRVEVEVLRYILIAASRTNRCRWVFGEKCVLLGAFGRAEMMCKVEEVKREMESRLDSQRRHMVQKESQLKNEVEELKVTRQSFSCGQLGQTWDDFNDQNGTEKPP